MQTCKHSSLACFFWAAFFSSSSAWIRLFAFGKPFYCRRKGISKNTHTSSSVSSLGASQSLSLPILEKSKCFHFHFPGNKKATAKGTLRMNLLQNRETIILTRIDGAPATATCHSFSVPLNLFFMQTRMVNNLQINWSNSETIIPAQKWRQKGKM